MQDKQDKKKKTNIKLNDLKPKKDAKGGVATNVSTATRAVASRVASRTKLTATSKEKQPRHGSIPRAVLVYFSRLSTKESLTNQKGGGSPQSSCSPLADARRRTAV